MLHRILSKIINRPLLITPTQAEIIFSIVARQDGSVEPLLRSWEADRPRPESNRFMSEWDEDSFSETAPFRRIGGTAVIPVIGELVNRGAWIGANSGLVSYEGISAQIQAAVASKNVDRILLDIESPGGEAIGAFELAEVVRRANEQKPVFSISNGMAASAAYAMASGSKTIYSTESALTGSIGVVMLHLNNEKRLEKMGVAPTLIHAGAHKVDGNPFEGLSEQVRADLQSEVNKFYELFVSTVEAGRQNRMRADAIRATEARIYQGSDAKDVGLVDAVMSFEDVLGDITRTAVRPIQRVTGGIAAMTDKTEGAPAAHNADTEARAVAAARTAAFEEGRQAALADVQAIIDLPEAQGKETAAIEAALSGMKPDAAKRMLAKLPVSSTIAERAAASGVDQIASGAGAQDAKPKSGLAAAAEQKYGRAS